MTRLALIASLAALIATGLWLWLRFGGAVFFDAAMAFCL